MAFRVQEGNRHAKVVKEKQEELASATADNFALARQNREDELAYMAKQRAARRQSMAFRGDEARRHKQLELENIQEAAEEEQKSRVLTLQARSDVEEYRGQERRRRRESVVGRNLEAKRWAEIDREDAKDEAEVSGWGVYCYDFLLLPYCS